MRPRRLQGWVLPSQHPGRCCAGFVPLPLALRLFLPCRPGAASVSQHLAASVQDGGSCCIKPSGWWQSRLLDLLAAAALQASSLSRVSFSCPGCILVCWCSLDVFSPFSSVPSAFYSAGLLRMLRRNVKIFLHKLHISFKFNLKKHLQNHSVALQAGVG